MNSLLRHPGLVPSLFSDGIDGDTCPSSPDRLGRRMAARIAQGLSQMLRHHRREPAFRQAGPVVAVAGLVCVMCGTLLHAAAALIGSGTP